ncbi:MAG: PLD nuclease N-terminal domain-containing protein [Dehalococcoidales bacterium]|jgi:hypothetical protein|nr:PLD nuclease N-terminal domain-containing protein [Dehalococcoidales bacterium]MDD4229793.1 PLD nuclease N-terminal domain-containing protein [Dehalococcoidales bacterium]MDD4465203.1 PLD nuclease N-terminal domain-containing protein [Dehalococcoidales bacterium]MDD5402112.1 PLD nuclease N-terminal domain-containing protein [Dehalococcoidales bacterium]
MPDELAIIKEILPFLIPLVLIQLALMVIALIDLLKREYVTGNNKVLWLIVILVINLVGPILYLLLGRKEKPDDSY